MIVNSARSVIIDNEIKTKAIIDNSIENRVSISVFDKAEGVYQGAYTVTPSNEVQTLETAGMKMAQDITIEKIDMSDITAKADDVFPGKKFRDADGILTTGTLQPLEKISDLWTGELTLADTSYPTWTASTTATSILATTNLGTFEADMDSYIYVIKWKYRFDADYLEGVTKKAIPIRQCMESWQTIYRRFNTLAQLKANTRPSYNAVATQFTAPALEYYNTSGTATLYVSATYGIYMTVQAATFSSTTAANPTVTYKRPVIYARCNTSYFATGRKAYIDTASKIKIKAELYRLKMSTSIQDAYDGVQDIFNNGI